MRTSLIVTLALFLAVFALAPGSARADCTSPAAVEGQTIYNTDYHVLQFCDGSSWKRVGAYTASNTPCGFGYGAGSCPTASSSITGCKSGRTLSWTTVSCSTSGNHRLVTLDTPLVDGFPPNGADSAAASFAAQYFCADIGLILDGNTNATVTSQGYWQRDHSGDDSGWLLRSSTSDAKVQQVVCYDNTTVP